MSFLAHFTGSGVPVGDWEEWYRYTRIMLGMKFGVSPDEVDGWDIQTIYDINEYLAGANSAQDKK